MIYSPYPSGTHLKQPIANWEIMKLVFMVVWIFYVLSLAYFWPPEILALRMSLSPSVNIWLLLLLSVIILSQFFCVVIWCITWVIANPIFKPSWPNLLIDGVGIVLMVVPAIFTIYGMEKASEEFMLIFVHPYVLGFIVFALVAVFHMILCGTYPDWPVQDNPTYVLVPLQNIQMNTYAMQKQ